MVYDDGIQRPTDEIPNAYEAFVTEDVELHDSPEYAVSRAATLLTLARPITRESLESDIEQETRADLGVPPVALQSVDREEIRIVLSDAPGLGNATAEVAFSPEARRPAIRELLRALPDRDSPRELLNWAEPVARAQREAAERLFSEPGGTESTTFEPRRSFEATQLNILSLLDLHPLVRVAAAIATRRIDRGNPLASAVLADARTGRLGDEVALLASLGAGGGFDRRGRSAALGAGGAAPGDDGPDAALVHGTWARRGRWWLPDGDFHMFLRDQGIFPHLYSGPDPFRWSGFYSIRARILGGLIDWDRLQAGSHLAWWAQRRLSSPPDIVGHSYGASISMCATRVEKEVRGLLLLSPAVHNSCVPDPAYFRGALVVRMKHDLVLLADRSNIGPLLRLTNVDERVLPRRSLLGHAGTHDPRVWTESGLDAFVRDQWLPSL